jgi:hypothetical protein
MSANGKTYTEVLLDVYDKIDTVEQRITGKLDATIRDNADFRARLAAGDEKFDAMDKRIDKNETSITKVRNLNTFIALLGSTVAGIIGINK